jgi:hypothetical protein
VISNRVSVVVIGVSSPTGITMTVIGSAGHTAVVGCAAIIAGALAVVGAHERCSSHLCATHASTSLLSQQDIRGPSLSGAGNSPRPTIRYKVVFWQPTRESTAFSLKRHRGAVDASLNEPGSIKPPPPPGKDCLELISRQNGAKAAHV